MVQSVDLTAGENSVALMLSPATVRETVTVEEQSAGVTTSVSRLGVPLIETPQAIQIIPKQVIESQQVLRVGDAARNASGVTRARGYTDAADKYTIRGFLVDYSLKNGLKNNSLLTLTNVANVEQVEVLKGPASIAFGRIEPGGIINAVTKRPMPDWHLASQVIGDRFGLLRPFLDLNGPLNRDRSLLFRLNGDYERGRNHRDGVRTDSSFVAPALTWAPSNNTLWSFEGENLVAQGVPDSGLPLDKISLSLPVSRNLSEPGQDYYRNRNARASTFLTRQLTPG